MPFKKGHGTCLTRYVFMLMKKVVFIQRDLKNIVVVKAIEIKMAAGEAHWQNGVVERHIGTFKSLFGELSMDDPFEWGNQSIDCRRDL